MMKVAVLMGGFSKEREISLRSGQAVSAALKQRGYEVFSVDAGEDLPEKLKLIKPDAAFIALHGKYGEDGCVQGMLEWLKIPYTGCGVTSSSVCFDKILTKEWLRPWNIQMPEQGIYQKNQDPNEWLKKQELEFPVVVKPNTEGSTLGMSRVFCKEELLPALALALQFDSSILVEKCIQGRELTVGVLNGKALPLVEVVPQGGFYDYKAKYTKGLTEYHVPAHLSLDLTTKIQQTSETINRILKCEGAVRMDYMLASDNHFYFLEVNTLPGMTETSLLPKAAHAANMEFDELCDQILKSACLKVGT